MRRDTLPSVPMVRNDNGTWREAKPDEKPQALAWPEDLVAGLERVEMLPARSVMIKGALTAEKRKTIAEMVSLLGFAAWFIDEKGVSHRLPGKKPLKDTGQLR